MSTIKVTTLDTLDGTGNITVSRPLSGSGASLTSLTAANLTGALPAINGAALTNLPLVGGEITKQSSDPTVSSPATPTLGDVIVNTTSGEMFICTTVSVGANVWSSNVGDGSALTSLTAANLTGTLPVVSGAALTNLPSATLTGALPAVSGAALTGIITGPTVSASDPVIDTNPAGGLGSQWANSTSGEFYICTDATTDENIWTNVGAGSGDIVPILFNGGRGIWVGGMTTVEINNIDYITISTTGNATDFGDRTVTYQLAGSCSNGSRGLTGGGWGPSNVIDYVTFATPGNAIDFGNLTTTRGFFASLSNGLRGVWGGGVTYGNVIDYVTIATPGNAIDFGDLTIARRCSSGISNATRGLFAGAGNNSSNFNVIDYITIASAGNAIDFGNLSVARGGSASSAGTENDTRGIIAGGAPWTGNALNTIDYVTIATTGNATDFGDLTRTAYGVQGCSSGTRGVFGGGNLINSGQTTNILDYITIATTGNAIDFGDLTSVKHFTASTSGD
jgi:hypothetical protein